MISKTLSLIFHNAKYILFTCLFVCSIVIIFSISLTDFRCGRHFQREAGKKRTEMKAYNACAGPGFPVTKYAQEKAVSLPLYDRLVT